MKLKSLFFGVLTVFSSSLFGQSIEKGLKHMELEQYESAKRLFKNLIKQDPLNPEYYYYLGEVYIKTENNDSASYCFSEGIKKKENFALNYAGLGKALAENNAAEGKKNFDKALELSKSKDAKVLASIADYYINAKNKDLVHAILLMDKAIKDEPKNPVYYFLMGDAYLEKNDGSKAISYYNQGLALNKSWPYAYLKIGRLYGRSKNYNAALENYKKGLAIDSLYGPLHRETAEVYYKARKYPKAIESMKKSVDLSDKTFDTELRYASFLYFNEDYPAAIKILSQLAKKDETHPVVNRLLSYSYFEIKEYEQGLATMEKFWNSNSKKQLSSDFEYYGKLLSKTGKDSLAILNLRKAIEMDTSKGDLYAEIGNMYFLSKKYLNAIDAYNLKIARSASPQDFLMLGKSYYNNKMYLQADSTFSKLVAVVPTSPTGYLWRARANVFLDKTNTKGLAKPFYEKYIELDKAPKKEQLIEAYSSIGAYYMNKQDKANADIAWKKVKELDPTNKEVDGYIKAKY